MTYLVVPSIVCGLMGSCHCGGRSNTPAPGNYKYSSTNLNLLDHAADVMEEECEGQFKNVNVSGKS